MSKDAALLFTVVRFPATMSLSASMPERRSVSQQVLPEDIVDDLREVTKDARALVEKHLCRLEHSSLYFIGPPLATRKPVVDAELAALDARYAPIRAAIKARWAEVAASMTSFYADYGEYVTRRRPLGLDAAAIDDRFRVKATWIPFNLPQELRDQLFTPEEQARIRREIEEAAQAAVAEKVEGYLGDLVSGMETALKALNEGRTVNRKTLRKVSEAFEEIAAIVPETDGASAFAAQIDFFGGALNELQEARERYDGPKKEASDATAAMFAAAAKAKSIAVPMLDKWQESAYEVPATMPTLAPAPPADPLREFLLSADADLPADVGSFLAALGGGS